jgi:hypothetical protein
MTRGIPLMLIEIVFKFVVWIHAVLLFHTVLSCRLDVITLYSRLSKLMEGEGMHG